MPVVLTIDQRGSRSHRDEVPRLLAALARALPSPALVRGFQRTVGDELQGVLDDPAAVTGALAVVLREGGWSTGVGIGEVEEPLPDDARAGRGVAYLAARDAVTRAKSSTHPVAVVGGDHYRAEQLETVLWLWSGIAERRTQAGWEVADALAGGRSHAEAGRLLGVTQSAVTQRVRTAGLADERRARRLAEQLLCEQLPATSTVPRRGQDREGEEGS